MSILMPIGVKTLFGINEDESKVDLINNYRKHH